MATYDSMLGFYGIHLISGVNDCRGWIFDAHQVNILRVVVYWLPAILVLIFRRRLSRNSNRIENLFVNMSVVSAFILTIGLVQGANLYTRMAAYFEIATAIALPWMIKEAVYQTVCLTGNGDGCGALFRLFL